ncbi:MAG: cupin domain-containing protein [Deltaproteobacteria bacterium]|nr:cupin domain-containing protein [Deltaproteobacteria bacterium]
MAEVEFIDLAPHLNEDPRGLAYFPWQTQELRDPASALRTFHLISIVPGQVRGNHFHPAYEEWLYVFHGRGIFRWETGTAEVRERLIADGRTMIRIPPGVAHAIENPGPEILYLIAWRERSGTGAAELESVPKILVHR